MNNNSKNEPEQKLHKQNKETKKLQNESQKLNQNQNQNKNKNTSNSQSNSTIIKNQIKEIPHLFAHESDEYKSQNKIQSKVNCAQSELPTKIEQTYDFGKNLNNNLVSKPNNLINSKEESKERVGIQNHEIQKEKIVNMNIAKEPEDKKEVAKLKELQVEIIECPENIMNLINNTNSKIESNQKGFTLKLKSKIKLIFKEGMNKKADSNGYTYFGSGEVRKENSNSQEQAVDYQLPNIPGISDVHFYIKYDSSNNNEKTKNISLITCRKLFVLFLELLKK